MGHAIDFTPKKIQVIHAKYVDQIYQKLFLYIAIALY